MSQQAYSQGRFAASNTRLDAANRPIMLINTKGLFLKPLTITQIATIPQLPNVVVPKGAKPDPAQMNFCDQQTVLLERILPRGTLPPLQHTSMSISHLNRTLATPQDKPDMLTLVLNAILKHFKNTGEFIWYTVAASFIMVIYMLTPLSMVLSPLLSNNWYRLCIALEILGLVELIIFRILKRTTPR